MNTQIDKVGDNVMVSLASTACHAIMRARDHAQLVEVLAGILQGHGVDRLALSWVCEGTDELEILAAWDARGEAADVGERFSRDAYAGLTLATAAFISNDCEADDRLDGDTRQRLAAEQIRSLCLYPIRQQSELVGVLSLSSRALHVHDPEQRALLDVIATLASTVLLGLEGHAQSRRQHHRWKAMRRAAEVLGSMSDEDELLAAAANLLVDEIGMVDAFIGTVDEAAGCLRERANAGASVQPGRVPLTFQLTDRYIHIVNVIFTGTPTIIRDALQHAELEGWGNIARAAKLRNAVVAPLRVGDTVLGAMGTGQALVDISESDLLMVTTFANLLANALLRARADNDRQRRLADLEAAYAQQIRLLETVRELSTPVIPVHDGILVLPLVGHIDTARGEQITEALLHGIEQAKAKVVICDVTGVPFMDSAVADALLRSMRAVALLGASSILVGISPTVAQTLISLGVELEGVTTCRDLQAGIARGLSMLHGARGASGPGRPIR